MSFYKHEADKKSGDGLALTEWNDLSNAVAGNSGLTLAMTATDKIGIGTIPKQKLHVKDGGLLIDNGGLRVESTHNSVTPDIGAFLAKNLTQGIGIGYNRIEAIGSNADQHILLKPKGKGNIGIGTTSSPEEKLQVSGNIKATKFIGDGSGLTNLSVGTTGLNLATSSGSKVGIGTDNPEDKLQIGGFQAGDRYLSVTTAGGNRYKAGIKLLAWKKDFGFIVENDDVKHGLHFHFHNPYDGLVSKENILFLSSINGNVGIGTIVPKRKLDINGSITFANDDVTKDVSERGLYWHAKSGYGIYRTAGNWKAPNYQQLKLSWSTGIILDPGSKYGKSYVDIRGNLRLSGSGNYCQMFTTSNKLVFKIKTAVHGSNKGMYWDGDTNWDSYSDERLKTNVTSEQNILSRLMKLDVKNYDWKGEPKRKTKMIGFIAQDVKPLFPALVGEIEDPETKQNYMTLKYANFGVLAIGAIKELKLEHDRRISALENQLHKIEGKINLELV